MLAGIGIGLGTAPPPFYLWFHPPDRPASQKIFAYVNAVVLAAGCLAIQTAPAPGFPPPSTRSTSSSAPSS